jgi:CheY-like chemotaxis protein
MHGCARGQIRQSTDGFVAAFLRVANRGRVLREVGRRAAAPSLPLYGAGVGMTNDTHTSSSRKGTLRTVAVVTKHPQPDLLDTLLDAGGYDIVFVESLDRAYATIKRAAPELVIVCLEIDDAESVQLLSILRLDEDTARIPIATFVVPCSGNEADRAAIDIDRYAPVQPAILPRN